MSADTPKKLYDLGELRSGNLEVLIAADKDDIVLAQKLRYRVFVEEMGAKASKEDAVSGIDEDEFDAVCDHLLVVEHQPEGGYKVVGTYRMLRRTAMQKIGRFYSESEFDISKVKAFDGEILEVGRSCVHQDYRERAVMQLLWRGIGAYVSKFEVGIMFGCASFHGVDPSQHAATLSYLNHFHLAPPELRSRALASRYVRMNMISQEEIDKKAAFSALPPLIKGYLRLSGYIGDGAVIDYDYNTIDVAIIVKTDLVTSKYANRYGSSG